jgi:hypothetical protein
MSLEVDSIMKSIEEALVEAACSDEPCSKRIIIEKGLRQANRLEEVAPTYFNTFHVQGILWYHHPDKTPERVRNAMRYFLEALKLNPVSHFTIHYLGCLYFYEGDWANALHYFAQTDRQYFEAEDKRWR